MIKVNVLGIKEGVGKTTVALYLSRELAKIGKTLIVDKTPTCGLGRKMWINGEMLCEGNLCMLKLFRKPFRMDSNDLERASRKLREIYSENWDYVVIDNFSCAIPDNPIIKLDIDSLPLFVTDPFNLGVTLEYSEKFYSKFGLVINQVPEGYSISKDIEKLFQVVVSIPFVVEEYSFGKYLQSIVASVAERRTSFM
ncbi:ParA family protein [Sulfuracidifex metallicus]|uniref:ParA family protein n=1 Tax=Sulfuracidifex metallicus TaxID=47303 RepID=UPI002273FE15|nr:ParA family protein [Sulfuracidifex metallicus]MCY0849879.1 ParA family protein [Sulfuracidifex metallicus]